MPRNVGTLTFPDFSGLTRTLILWNIAIFFVLLILGMAAPQLAGLLSAHLALSPARVMHGEIWQLVTYSFLHGGLVGTALELLSLWFLGSFLEQDRGSHWMGQLYFVSVIGTGVAAVLITLAMSRTLFPLAGVGIIGSFGGIFGLLIAFGVLYGEMQFLMFFLFSIKAKYLVAIYILIAFASFFLGDKVYAFAQLCGALCGYIYIKTAPRRGYSTVGTEWWFGMRNDYYRWKRRRAARKFQVYMKKQDRDVEFDREGRYIDPDSKKNPNDKRWMN
jgi:membrane associated rhomboid family serine protease